MLKTTGISAILITFGLSAAVAGCGTDAAVTPTAGASATAVSTSTTFTPPTSSTTTAAPSAAATKSTTSTTSTQRFVCPDGGAKEAAVLQRSVDAGHQPWWLSPKDVAAACTFGIPDATVKALGADSYRVTQTSTGKKVVVNETQPGRTGSTGIWVVTRKTPVP